MKRCTWRTPNSSGAAGGKVHARTCPRRRRGGAGAAVFTLPQCKAEFVEEGTSLERCPSPMGISSVFNKYVIRADLYTPLLPDLQPLQSCLP